MGHGAVQYRALRVHLVYVYQKAGPETQRLPLQRRAGPSEWLRPAWDATHLERPLRSHEVPAQGRAWAMGNGGHTRGHRTRHFSRACRNFRKKREQFPAVRERTRILRGAVTTRPRLPTQIAPRTPRRAVAAGDVEPAASTPRAPRRHIATADNVVTSVVGRRGACRGRGRDRHHARAGGRRASER